MTQDEEALALAAPLIAQRLRGGGSPGGKGNGKGAKGGAKVVVEPHRHEGVFVARGKEDVLVTKSMVPGDAVYGEKRISVEEGEGDDKTKIEYRVWNPFPLEDRRGHPRRRRLDPHEA